MVGTKIIFSNGKIESRGVFKHGHEDGYWEYFYENGSFFSKVNYKSPNGFHGKYASFFENGNTKIATNYYHHLIDGDYCVYHENGTLATKGFYIKGKEHGKWEEYNEEGNLVARCTYHQGERIKEWEFYNHNKK